MRTSPNDLRVRMFPRVFSQLPARGLPVPVHPGLQAGAVEQNHRLLGRLGSQARRPALHPGQGKLGCRTGPGAGTREPLGVDLALKLTHTAGSLAQIQGAGKRNRRALAATGGFTRVPGPLLVQSHHSPVAVPALGHNLGLQDPFNPIVAAQLSFPFTHSGIAGKDRSGSKVERSHQNQNS